MLDIQLILEILAVVAGNGLVGGSTSGSLSVGAGTGVTVNSGNVAIGQQLEHLIVQHLQSYMVMT